MQNLGLVAILNVFGLTELGSLSVIKGSIQRMLPWPWSLPLTAVAAQLTATVAIASLFSISLPTRRLLAASQWVIDGEKGLYYNVRNITTHLKEAWSGLGSFRIRPF